MPPRIVLDHPHGQTRSALGRGLRTLLGALLVALGLAATVVAVPTGFVTAGDILVTVSEEPDPTEPLFPPEFPLREVEAAFVISVIVAIIGLRHGRRLVRGRRSAVLFLRRFGYLGSMQAVTYAVTRTIGGSWRLVTLDDAAIAPLGVPSASRVLFRAGEYISRAAQAAGRGIFLSFKWVVWGMWATVGVQILVIAPDWERLLRDDIAGRYTTIAATIMDGRVPLQYYTPTLPGLFALFATGVALCLGGLLVMMIVLLSSFPLFGVVMLATSSAEALRKAEESKTRTIAQLPDLDRAVRAVAHGARETFAPRLVVLRVATPIWQQTVSALAAVSSSAIIDVSEATENIVWELQELDRLCPGRYVLIGEHSRIVTWAEPASLPADTLEARFAACLDSHALLAYTTDKAGMHRFAHALHGMLLDIDDGP